MEVLATLLRRLRGGAEPGVLRHLVVSPRFSVLLGVRAVSPGAARGLRALFFGLELPLLLCPFRAAQSEKKTTGRALPRRDQLGGSARGRPDRQGRV